MTYKTITRDMALRGDVQPKVLENGAVSPAIAQVNTMTRPEHDAYLRIRKQPPLTPEEIERIYPPPAVEVEPVASPRMDFDTSGRLVPRYDD